MLCYALIYDLRSSHVYLYSSSYIIMYVLIYYHVHMCSLSYVSIYLYVSRLSSTLTCACIRMYAPHTCGCVSVCMCLLA